MGGSSLLGKMGGWVGGWVGRIYLGLDGLVGLPESIAVLHAQEVVDHAPAVFEGA